MEGTFWRLCPQYMAIGMSADEFWNGPLELCGAYREAWTARLDLKYVEEWRQGVYTYRAFAVVMDHAFNKHATSAYPEEPLWSSEKLAEERDRDRARRKAEAARDAFRAHCEAVNARIRRERERRGEEA